MLKTTSITRALKHRNYRLFFSGQSISLIGTWLTRVASSWLVYRLSNSAFILGLVGFIGQFPTFALAPLAGVLVDRWDRHRVLVVTQILAMIQSALMAVLTLTGVISIPQVLILSAFQGVINAFDMPARQAFVVEMIEDRKDLSNAIALNSSMVNMARLLGPSCAGILIALVGEGGCFTIDAVSYLAVIASLLLMTVKKRTKGKAKPKDLWGELREGLYYATKFRPIRDILLLLGLVSLMGMPYTVLLPMIASEELHGGAHTLGYLTAAGGLGAVIGVLYLASRKSVLGLGRIVAASAALFGSGLILFALSKSVWLSFLLMFVTGMGMMCQMASSNTILQTIVEEDKRGRVMSLFTVAVAGMVPFGSLMSGILADRMGAPNTIIVGGTCCILGGLSFLKALPRIREQVRPIYLQLGILPQPATGVPAPSPFEFPHEDN
jgi:MFS family permease